MASAGDILIVRGNVGEPTNAEPYTDTYIGGLIDASSVSGATATIWKQKAATYSTSVDVTEAGASHKFSDLFKNASAMAKFWDDQVSEETSALADRARVRIIERSVL